VAVYASGRIGKVVPDSKESPETFLSPGGSLYDEGMCLPGLMLCFEFDWFGVFFGRADNQMHQTKDSADGSHNHTSVINHIHPTRESAVVQRELVNLTSISERTFQGSLALQDILVLHRSWPLFDNPLPRLRGVGGWGPRMATRQIRT
jgi:hypothetical protein